VAKNPFLKTSEQKADSADPPKGRDDILQEALDAANKPAADADDAPVVKKPAESESVDDDPHALFDDEEESLDDDDVPGDDSDEALFDTEEPPDDGGTVSKKTFLTRLNKVIAQRNERDTTIASLESALKSAEAMSGVFKDRYKGHQNPAAMVEFDVNFMESLEKLAQSNSDVALLAGTVKHFMETGEVPKMNEQKQIVPPAPKAEAPKPDERITKIIARDAAKTVGDTLDELNVKPAFQKLITKHIIQAEGVELADLDRATVVAQAKAFVKANGFTAAEVLEGTPATQDPKPKPKPATGGSPGAATVPPKVDSDGKPEDTPAAPKTRDEWEARRNDRLAKLVSE
jgi:hypothetical protein